MTDWWCYRQCTVCMAGTGNACIIQHAIVSNGAPSGGAIRLAFPHKSRKLRSRRRHDQDAQEDPIVRYDRPRHSILTCLACRINAEVRRRDLAALAQRDPAS